MHTYVACPQHPDHDHNECVTFPDCVELVELYHECRCDEIAYDITHPDANN